MCYGGAGRKYRDEGRMPHSLIDIIK